MLTTFPSPLSMLLCFCRHQISCTDLQQFHDQCTYRPLHSRYQSLCFCLVMDTAPMQTYVVLDFLYECKTYITSFMYKHRIEHIQYITIISFCIGFSIEKKNTYFYFSKFLLILIINTFMLIHTNVDKYEKNISILCIANIKQKHT